MSVLMARYRVRELDRFRAVFDGFEATRAERGSTGHRLLVSPEEPTRVVVLIDFPSRAAAEGFASSAERLTALEEAGVVERDDEILEEVAR
jgi:hypothetical protein